MAKGRQPEPAIVMVESCVAYCMRRKLKWEVRESLGFYLRRPFAVVLVAIASLGSALAEGWRGWVRKEREQEVGVGATGGRRCER